MTRKMRANKDLVGEWVPIGDLTPWDKNPRDNDHAVQSVADSIKRFGWGSVIVARKSDGVVIAGHTRLKAAEKLGMDKVPVRYLDLDPAEAAALALADNKVGELADWDDDILGEVLTALEADGVDLAGLGFSDEELAALLDPPAADIEDDNEDEVPDVFDGEAESRQGEVYHLGPHRLICGDCRDPEVVSRLLTGERINVAFTSPPYASQRKYDESSGFKPIPPDEYGDWFEAVQANVREHLADDGSWFVNIKAHCEDGQRHLYVMDLVLRHAREWGWDYIDELCWHRTSIPGFFKGRFKNAWEPIHHFANNAGCKHRPDAVGAVTFKAFKYQGPMPDSPSGSGMPGGDPDRHEGISRPPNVIQMGSSGKTVTGEHEAEFPVGLPSFFVRAYSDSGDAIFDPFLGSGTTLIAAAKHGRTAYGCEISPTYCDVIRRRWTRYAAKHNLDAGSGALED